jgi:hypothetical protein
MARRSDSKKSRLAALLQSPDTAHIDPALFWALKLKLDPISEPYLRRLLRQSDARLHPLVEGVAQTSLPELERTLVALSGVYEEPNEPTKAACRKLVIAAKDHLRWSMRRQRNGEQAEKSEMLLWLLTWLENPMLFPAWVLIRTQARNRQ